MVFISLIPNVIEAMSWLIDECFFICETYYRPIQQQKKKKKKKEEGQTFCHLCHLIMDMLTHTDIFSTLYTQETWNMIIYTKD